MLYTFLQHKLHKGNLSNFVGHWCYEKDKGFLFDRACSQLFDVEYDSNNWVDKKVLIAKINKYAIKRLLRTIEEKNMGDIILESFSIMHGSFAGEKFISQGSVIKRDEDGHAVHAFGNIAHLTSPVAEFFIREITGDGLYMWNAYTDEVYASSSYHVMLGYSSDEYPKTFTEFFRKLVHPDDNDALFLQEKITSSINYGDSYECCIRLKHKNGNYIWTIGRGKVIERNSDGIATCVIGSQTNINLMRENFENIKLLMFTDSLTGMHNRTYFQQNSIYYEQSNIYPLSVIFVDVTGLKLTNDILGHNYGDYLILKTCEIIQKALTLANFSIHLPDNYEPNKTIDLGDAALDEDNDLYDVNKDEYEQIVEKLDSEKTLIQQKKEDSLAKLNENAAQGEDKTENQVEIVRLAGDEFVVVLPFCSLQKANETAQLIQEVRKKTNADCLKMPSKKRPVPIMFGIGVANVGDTSAVDNEQVRPTFASAVDCADQLMQQNKDSNRKENYAVLQEYFEMKKGRKVSMRDERRLDLFTSDECKTIITEQFDSIIK